MKIRIKMTSHKAREMGISTGSDLCLAPVDIDESRLSPAAEWIAKHITATYVIDEHRDKCDIVAVAGFSMEDRDRRAGVPEDKIKRCKSMYGTAYTEPMQQPVVFPTYGATCRSPEEVIEMAVRELRSAGAAYMVHRDSGDRIDL